MYVLQLQNLIFLVLVGIPSGTSSIEQVSGVKALIEQLARITDISNDHQEAKLWRHLGKIQLDAGEYAEARQIFCHGSKQCPSDSGLRHHLRVWTAFHGDVDEYKSDSSCKKPAPQPLGATANPDVFVSLDVPDEAIPNSVKKWDGARSERRRLIHASKEPVLTSEACKFLIHSALNAVEERGWTRDRHVQAPTCDIPIFDLSPEAQRWCREAFHNVLFPLLASTFAPELNIDPLELRIQDCFIVRYDGNEESSGGPGFASLNPHEDESLLSLTVALNDMSEYDGGGLFIKSTGDLLNGDAGTVLCFAGGLVHGGYPVSRGTRWILTVFLYVDANESRKRPGYTLDAIDKLRHSTREYRSMDKDEQKE